MPLWATLLMLVSAPPLEEPDTEWRHAILEDLVKKFQGFLDKLKWREIRLFVR